MRFGTLALLIALGLAAGASLARAQAPQPHSGYAELPGVHLWYADSGGSGTPLIMLHSSTGTASSWEHLIPVFTAAGYRCIAYDRRGWGRSKVDSAGPQPGTASADLAALMDHLRIDRAHLIGTAAGSTVTLDFVLSYPQRIRSAVIANAGGASIPDPKFQEMSQRIKTPEFDSYPPDFRELGPSYRAANPEGVQRWHAITRTSRQTPAVVQPVKTPVTMALMEAIRTPILLMTGGADLYAPPPLMKLYAARVKHAETVVVPEAGHSAYWEQPEFFSNAVLQFLQKHN